MTVSTASHYISSYSGHLFFIPDILIFYLIRTMATYVPFLRILTFIPQGNVNDFFYSVIPNIVTFYRSAFELQTKANLLHLGNETTCRIDVLKTCMPTPVKMDVPSTRMHDTAAQSIHGIRHDNRTGKSLPQLASVICSSDQCGRGPA